MADGSVSIMSFVTNDFRGVEQKATKKNIDYEIQKTFSQRDIKPVKWKIVNEADIPEDRTYRNAWTHDGKKFSIHMGKAKELHRNILREERNRRLEALDVNYLVALEMATATGASEAAKDGLQIIAKNKQKLRDITIHSKIEAAKTPEDLKKLTIDNLLNGI